MIGSTRPPSPKADVTGNDARDHTDPESIEFHSATKSIHSSKG